MRKLRRYSDPTMGFDRFSAVKYGNGGSSRLLKGYNTDGSEILDYTPGSHLNELSVKPTIGAFKAPSITIPTGSTSVAGAGKADRMTVKGAMNDLMPYASNIINSFRKLPRPIAPGIEAPASYTPISLDADRAGIRGQETAFGKETDYRVGNRAVAQGLKANMKGKSVMALNDLSQKEAVTNASFRNRYDEMNQGVQVRNLARGKQFNDEILSRSLKEQELDAENLANLSDKYQVQTKDKALQYQEGEKNYIQSFGVDESLLGPNSRKNMEQWRAAQMKKLGYTPPKAMFGGQLKRMR